MQQLVLADDGVCNGDSVPWLMWVRFKDQYGPVADEHMLNLRGGAETLCRKDIHLEDVLSDIPEEGITICPSCVETVVADGNGGVTDGQFHAAVALRP